MNTLSSISLREAADADLATASAAGDRSAFAEIVARYQSLVCSVTYSGTGGLQLSEDLAQETFVTAWKQLPQLREPEKLRAWLCGIARNVAHNTRRRLGREPAHGAESLDLAGEAAALEPLPSEQAISREQEAILWSALGRVPETYREPLVLFYREHQSIERVAAELELTEDAVKQRLSRGRKLLHEQVAAFLEGALARSGPGTMFTAGVLAALPAFTLPSTASAATLATTAKSGAAAFGAANLAAVAGMVLGPVTGLVGAWAGYRAGLAGTRTPAERAFVKRWTLKMLAVSTASALLVGLLVAGALVWWKAFPPALVALVVAAALGNFVLLFALIARFRRGLGALRVAERLAHPEAFADEHPGAECLRKYYTSRATFLGVPLLDVRYGTPEGERIRPAFGWFACGDVAIGLLGAVGGVAVAPVAFGAVAIGLCAIGALSIAGVAVAAVAVGGLALGGVSIGVIAVGGVAMGWAAALGGASLAHEIAIGGVASAAHANDAVAHAYLSARPWLDVRNPALVLVLNLLWLPSVLIAWLAIWRLRVSRRGRA